MRYFCTLLLLRLKAGARGPFFWGMLVLFVGLAYAFCALLPQREQINVRIGLHVAEEAALPVGEALLHNEDYRFTVYQSEAELKQSVLTGETHCGYYLGGGERPITLYATKGSYMAPIVNEVVLSAYMDARAPGLMKEFLEAQDLPVPENPDAYFAGLRERSKPMTVELSTPEGLSLAEGSNGMQLLLYAVLGALLPAAAVLRALLRGREAGVVSYPVGRAGESALAQLCADALLGAAALLAADAVITGMSTATAYPAQARLFAIGVLAVLAAVCSVLALPLAARPTVPLLALPVVLVLWVLLSGAVLSPALLPGGLGVLRWFSPPWYFLQMLTIFAG